MRAPIGKEQRQILKKGIALYQTILGVSWMLGCACGVYRAVHALCACLDRAGSRLDHRSRKRRLYGAFFGSSENGGRDFFDRGGAMGDECLQ